MPPASGQDAEEAAELMATMRADHVKMKAWYNHPDRASDAALSRLKERHGATFPAFWQDLVKWDGWKDVRREYLLFLENKSGGGGDNGNNRPSRRKPDYLVVGARRGARSISNRSRFQNRSYSFR